MTGVRTLVDEWARATCTCGGASTCLSCQYADRITEQLLQPDLSLREQLVLELGKADGQPWQTLADAPSMGEFMYGKQADAVLVLVRTREDGHG